MPRLCRVAKEYEERYFDDLKKHVEKCPGNRLELKSALQDPRFSAQVFFGMYAFQRAGSERAGYGQIASNLLREGENYPSGADFWKAFEYSCGSKGAKGVKTNERMNKELLEQGHLKLFDRTCKQAGWLYELGQRMADEGVVLPAYLELLSIHSIGPKIAAFLCRDLVWIFDCEKEVLASEQLMLQPVDTWIRQVAELLWPKFKHLEAGKADFLIATQIVSVSHQLDQSGVAFNQGSWHFGSRELRPGETLDSGLQRLANEPN
jgi:hypothetical protein